MCCSVVSDKVKQTERRLFSAGVSQCFVDSALMCVKKKVEGVAQVVVMFQGGK